MGRIEKVIAINNVEEVNNGASYYLNVDFTLQRTGGVVSETKLRIDNYMTLANIKAKGLIYRGMVQGQEVEEVAE